MLVEGLSEWLFGRSKAGKKTPAESLEMPYFACVFR
jgi:hypothetical protein